jgi:hypothetical protein
VHTPILREIETKFAACGAEFDHLSEASMVLSNTLSAVQARLVAALQVRPEARLFAPLADLAPSDGVIPPLASSTLLPSCGLQAGDHLALYRKPAPGQNLTIDRRPARKTPAQQHLDRVARFGPGDLHAVESHAQVAAQDSESKDECQRPRRRHGRAPGRPAAEFKFMHAGPPASAFLGPVRESGGEGWRQERGGPGRDTRGMMFTVDAGLDSESGRYETGQPELQPSRNGNFAFCSMCGEHSKRFYFSKLGEDGVHDAWSQHTHDKHGPAWQ